MCVCAFFSDCTFHLVLHTHSSIQSCMSAFVLQMRTHSLTFEKKHLPGVFVLLVSSPRLQQRDRPFYITLMKEESNWLDSPIEKPKSGAYPQAPKTVVLEDKEWVMVNLELPLDSTRQHSIMSHAQQCFVPSPVWLYAHPGWYTAWTVTPFTIWIIHIPTWLCSKLWHSHFPALQYKREFLLTAHPACKF